MKYPTAESADTSPPYRVGEDTKLKMSVRTLLIIVGACAVAITSWAVLKAEVSAHTNQLDKIQITVDADHDQLKVQGTLIEQQGRMLERIERKIDRLDRPGGSVRIP